MLEDVRAESERLHRLVEDLLVLSRVERGRLEVDAEPLEPRRMLERIVAPRGRSNTPHPDRARGASPTCPSSSARRATSNRSCATCWAMRPSTRRPDGRHGGRRGRRAGCRRPGERRRPGDPARLARAPVRALLPRPGCARTVSGSGIGLFVVRQPRRGHGRSDLWVARHRPAAAEFGFTMRSRTWTTPDQHDGVHGRSLASGTTDVERAEAEPRRRPIGHLRPDADEAPLVSPEERQADEPDRGPARDEPAGPDPAPQQRERADHRREAEDVHDGADGQLHRDDGEQADRGRIHAVEERPGADGCPQPCQDRDARSRRPRTPGRKIPTVATVAPTGPSTR